MHELERLKEIMEEEGLGYEKLSRILGVSLGTVMRWFHNKSNPSDLALIQIRKFISKHKKEEK